MASHTHRKSLTIWCIGKIVNMINTDCTDGAANKIFLVPCQSIFTMVFIHIFFPVSFGIEKIGRKKKGEKKEKKRKKNSIQGQDY